MRPGERPEAVFTFRVLRRLEPRRLKDLRLRIFIFGLRI